MEPYFSFIIPVYNRPDEIEELLESLMLQGYDKPFEVVIVEDGSSNSAKGVVEKFKEELLITYLAKNNTGPGDSRNYGMNRAKGNYFLVLDSDCILPEHYLESVDRSLREKFAHCFGGPDAAHPSFSKVQKAINHAMTSVLTTGGIRGHKKALGKFQPRSFNMGISKVAFEKVGGFGNIHPGEDPDLTFRIWENGFDTKLIPDAFVYHKRRIDWRKFYVQMNKFGMVRPILNKWHRGTAKPTYWFPTFFCFGFVVATIMFFFGVTWPILPYMIYFVAILIDALLKTKDIGIALLAVLAAAIQFTGYGYGFLLSTILLNFSKKEPQEIFPRLFFKTAKSG